MPCSPGLGAGEIPGARRDRRGGAVAPALVSPVSRELTATVRMTVCRMRAGETTPGSRCVCWDPSHLASTAPIATWARRSSAASSPYWRCRRDRWCRSTDSCRKCGAMRPATAPSPRCRSTSAGSAAASATRRRTDRAHVCCADRPGTCSTCPATPSTGTASPGWSRQPAAGPQRNRPPRCGSSTRPLSWWPERRWRMWPSSSGMRPAPRSLGSRNWFCWLVRNGSARCSAWGTPPRSSARRGR